MTVPELVCANCGHPDSHHKSDNDGGSEFLRLCWHWGATAMGKVCRCTGWREAEISLT